MIVSNPNNVKIYNLSAGKSLPEWLAERRKAKSSWKKSTEYQRQIELIQEFDMPAVTTTVKMTPDAQYIFATGIYKPRVKCFDVNNLSLKFERCFDSESVTFEILSDDYSKIVFLQCDRYIEFHAAFGRYFRLRVPKFGRDMTYHTPSCDLFVCGVGSAINRLNLERGQFGTPFVSDASEFYCGEANPQHHLLMFGSKEGKVEAWDPRSRTCASKLDCAMNCADLVTSETKFPSVTALKFRDGLNFAAGTASGQVLLYDLRSSRPLLIKDHMYGLPIKCLDFHPAQNAVLSLDASVLKIWNCETGKLFTSIEPGVELNQFCLVPNSGMMFISNESPKIQSYYIPALGPAPRWCGFLDGLTEELEESNHQNIYDDYKFITAKRADELGLTNLVGTNLMRAYMHGYFVDNRLYRKATALVEPFAYEEYRRKKNQEKIKEGRVNRVQLSQKLPQVNKELALKLMDQKSASEESKKKKKQDGSLLADDRFRALFENTDFEVDTNTEDFRLLNPVLSSMDAKKSKKLKKRIEAENEKEEEEEALSSSDEEDDLSNDSSSDDDNAWTKELRKQHKMIKREKQQREFQQQAKTSQPKMFELKSTEEFKWNKRKDSKEKRATLGDRLETEDLSEIVRNVGNSKEMIFSTRKFNKETRNRDKLKKHQDERKRLQRSVRGLKLKPIPTLPGRKPWRK